MNNKQREFESQTRGLKSYANDLKDLKDDIKLTAEEQRQYDSTDIQQKIVYGWMMAPLGLTTHIFGKLRSVYSTDACHAKTSLGGTFFMMCAEDSNDNIVTLGVAFFYDNESSSTWRRFLSFMRDVYPGLDSARSLFIADGDKGFKEVFKSIFPVSFRLFCLQHMLNPDKKVTAKDKSLYNEAAASANQDQIIHLYNKISESQRGKWEKAGIAINEMFPGLIPDISWGKTTSSCIESLNGAYGPIRYLHSADALVASINRETKTMASHKSCSMLCVDTIPPLSGRRHLAKLAENSNRIANVSRVRSTGNQLMWTLVTTLHDGGVREHVCSIQGLWCSCKKPSMTKKPCWHKLRTGVEVSVQGDSIFGYYFTSKYWKYQYADMPNLKPIASTDWEFKTKGDAIMPFTKKRGRGRPKEYKRIKGRYEIFQKVAKIRGNTMG